MEKRFVYADNAATTKPCKAAIDAANAAMKETWGNPSSVHYAGLQADKLIQEARETIAKIINAKSDEIYFTSGGTEADNIAILSAVKEGEKQGKKHIITTQIEHHAVLNIVKTLERERGFNVTYLPVDAKGVIKYDEFCKVISSGDICLVSVMTVNNETGAVQPVDVIGEVCRAYKIPFHTDAVQAVGHISVNVQEIKCDYLAASAHKFGGIKGAGFLYVKKGAPIYPLIYGGGQEKGIRAGTENVVGIAAMAAALKYKAKRIERNYKTVTELYDRLNSKMRGDANARYYYNYKINGYKKDSFEILGGTGNQVLDHIPADAEYNPYIMSVTFKGINAETLCAMLSAQGICVSAGSACNSKDITPSHVLKAMGLTDREANSTIRFSFDESMTEDDIDCIAQRLKENVDLLHYTT